MANTKKAPAVSGTTPAMPAQQPATAAAPAQAPAVTAPANPLLQALGLLFQQALTVPAPMAAPAVTAPAAVAPADPDNVEGWLVRITGADKAAEAAAAAAATVRKGANQVLRRFCVWLYKTHGAQWWTTAVGQTVLDQYRDRLKAGDCSNPSVYVDRFIEMAKNVYNDVERNQAEKEGRDAVLLPTKKDRPIEEAAEEALAKLWLRLEAVEAPSAKLVALKKRLEKAVNRRLVEKLESEAATKKKPTKKSDDGEGDGEGDEAVM